MRIAHETAGAARTRSSLRPLFSTGQGFRHTSGASRREIAGLCSFLCGNRRLTWKPPAIRKKP